MKKRIKCKDVPYLAEFPKSGLVNLSFFWNFPFLGYQDVNLKLASH